MNLRELNKERTRLTKAPSIGDDTALQKNIKRGGALVLAVYATLIILALLGTFFAVYTLQDSFGDKARVAKMGFNAYGVIVSSEGTQTVPLNDFIVIGPEFRPQAVGVKTLGMDSKGSETSFEAAVYLDISELSEDAPMLLKFQREVTGSDGQTINAHFRFSDGYNAFINSLPPHNDGWFSPFELREYYEDYYEDHPEDFNPKRLKIVNDIDFITHDPRTAYLKINWWWNTAAYLNGDSTPPGTGPYPPTPYRLESTYPHDYYDWAAKNNTTLMDEYDDYDTYVLDSTLQTWPYGDFPNKIFFIVEGSQTDSIDPACSTTLGCHLEWQTP